MKVGLLANRPQDVKPEAVDEPEQSQTDCIVALVTVEKSDSPDSVQFLQDDIKKMSQDIGHKHVVILPFAHLSNNLADSEDALKLLESLKEGLKSELEVKRSHFGSHKEFMVDVFGHPGNVRFREY